MPEEEIVLQVEEGDTVNIVVTEDVATIELIPDPEVEILEVGIESSVELLEITGIGPQGPPGPGLPAGGTTGQLIQKSGTGDYETEWTSEPEVDSLQFNLNAGIDPVADGQLAWNVDEGTLELGKGGVSNYIGQETMVLCRNASNSVAIPKGTAVRFAGAVGNSGRIKVAPMVADGTLPGYVFFGVTDQVIAGGSDGYVTVFGKIRGINTNAYDDGDILWCDPATPGGFTKTEPQAPNLKLAIAAVINAANNGVIFVRWSTGSRLQDLHDVGANGSKQDGDILAWNQTTGRWEASALLTTANSLAGLTDVEVSAKTNKSILYYDSATGKWIGDNLQTILTVTDGGNF